MVDRFLAGSQIQQAVLEVMRGRDRRCAVAFWSKNWVNGAGIDWADTRIVLDVSMGMTSPEAIETLGKHKATVKHAPNFHGKMYLSDRGAVIGSANASRSGVGLLNENASLQEIAVFLLPDSNEYRAAAAYFSTLFEGALSANDALEKAKVLYRPHRLAMGGASGFDVGSVLDRVCADPGSFGDIGFVFCGVPAKDTDALRDEDVLMAQEVGHEGAPEIRGSILFDDWDTDEIEAWPDRFLEFYINQNGGLRMNAYRTIFRNVQAGRVRASKAWIGTMQRAKLNFRQNKVVDADSDAAARIGRDVLKEKGRVFQNAEELRDALTK